MLHLFSRQSALPATEFRASGHPDDPQFSASGDDVDDAGALPLASPLLTEFRASGGDAPFFRASPGVQEPAPWIQRKITRVLFAALFGAVTVTCLLGIVLARTWRSSPSPHSSPPPPPPHPNPPPAPLMNRTWVGVTMSKDGSRVFAAVYNGMIYSSLDSGSSWTGSAATCCLNWMSLASSADGSVLLANADNLPQSLFISTDAGLSWWGAANSTSGRKHVAVSGDGHTLAAADEYGFISISLDGGSSWQTTRAPGMPVDWRAIAASHGGELLIVGGQGPTYTSSNLGVDWALTGVSQCWDFASSDDGRGLFASCAPGEAWVLYTSVDSGLSWQPRQSLPGMAYGAAIASSASGSTLVASWSGPFEVSGAGALNVSTNGGATWATRFTWPYTGRGGSFVAMSSDGCTIALACYSGFLYVTANCGLTWRAAL